MFNQLFREPAAIRRYLNAPLLEDRLLYLNHCAKQGNALTILCQIAKYQLGIIEHVPLETGSAHTLEEIKIAANRYMASYKPQTSCSEISFLTYKKEFIRYATHWLRFLGRLKVPEHPVPEQITAFVDYMQNEKGLSKASAIQRRHHLKIFFSQTRKKPDQFLAHLTPKQIDDALIQISQKGIYTHWSMQCIASSLRTFFKFTESRGWCPAGIADSIKLPRAYTHQTLPSGPSWENVQRLLMTTKENRPVDIRDRAILLLLAVYGLRDSEVRQLRLDDIDWENEIICIKRAKNGPVQQFPLVRTVGQALIRYIKEVRPQSSTHREVFLTMYAPFGPLRMLFNIVGLRWKPLNVAIKHHGPHSLRHACATRLINQDMSLKTIADQLGHRNLQTTGIYAKVNLSSLREAANLNMGGLS